MSQSTDILTELLASIEAYQIANLNEKRFVYEDEIRSDDQLDSRSELLSFHIGMDEQSADALLVTGDYRTNDVNQAYQIKIFFKIARENDYTDIVARPIREVKDMIVDWLDTLDVSTTTSQKLMYLQFIGNSAVERTTTYATMTIDLSAFRVLKNIH